MLCLYSLNAGHVTIVCETRLNFAATWRGFRTFSIPKEAVMIQKKNPWFAVSALAFGFVGGAISGELFWGPFTARTIRPHGDRGPGISTGRPPGRTARAADGCALRRRRRHAL